MPAAPSAPPGPEPELVAIARAKLTAGPGVNVDYVEARDATSLEPVDAVARPVVLAVAAFVGTTRLIDNRVLDPASSLDTRKTS